MFKYLLANLSDTPKEVNFKDISEFDRMEQRFFAIEQYYGDIVGMNVDSVEFCPNHNPLNYKMKYCPGCGLFIQN